MIDYLKIKSIIENADAIVIGAGAGLSTSAGINYGKEGFKENFKELVEKYNMTDMYTSSFYTFDTEEEKWSYLAKHINYLYNVEAKQVYINLYKLVRDKKYFVITTNVDGQFLKAGFKKTKVFEVQGSLSKIQCSVACHNKLYNDLDMVKNMLNFDEDCKIPSNLVPKCPVCKGKMEVNLRKDSYFVEDENFYNLKLEYEKFINANKEKNMVLLELGVGFNTPSIIRFPFESMSFKYDNTVLIRVNDKYASLTFRNNEKNILVKEDCGSFIKNVLER